MEWQDLVLQVELRLHTYARAVCLIVVVLADEKIGWEAGTRTPIARFRVWSPTIGRPPSSEIEFTSATPPKSNQIHYSESTVSRGAHALAFSAAFLHARRVRTCDVAQFLANVRPRNIKAERKSSCAAARQSAE